MYFVPSIWPCPFCVRNRDSPLGPNHGEVLAFFDFVENVYVFFENFPVGFGVCEGVQSIDASCGIQIDGFSVHLEPYGFIFKHFHDFGDFAVVSGGLTLFQKGPRTAKTALKVPGPCESVMLAWSHPLM